MSSLCFFPELELILYYVLQGLWCMKFHSKAIVVLIVDSG